jgi:predicted O-methyltransferase YrrM
MLDWIGKLFEHKDLTRMGHGQRVEDGNLGLGWLYYALGRIMRPANAVVIGSYRGFVPLVLGKALADNSERGQLYFIDPSLVDDFWKDPQAVERHFAGFGLANVRHFLMTTQEFVDTEPYRTLGPVGILFVDGYHSEEQARFDYEAFRDRLAPDGVVLFHDSIRIQPTSVYGPGRAYEHRVKCFIDTLKKDPRLQVFDLPFAAGVTLVRQADGGEGTLERPKGSET